jgi:hypothetical protein
LERIRLTWVLSLALAADEVLGDLGVGDEDVPLAVELRDGGPGVTVQAVTSLAASSVRVGVVG